MKSNVCDNSAMRDCTGCGICASVCGTKAINIQLGKDGFYKPIVDDAKCVECGLCKKSCYRYDDNLIQSNEVKACYAAVNKDEIQLRSSSSGGISRVLMEECIARGYKVFGCTYDVTKNIAKSIIATSVEELDQFYGSKYFQSYTVEGFNEILKDRTDQKYAIFGTPCHIYAFSQTNKYKRKPDNYLLVDIFCHGCPSFNLWKSYLQYTNQITGCQSYRKIAFRSKTHAWHEYCIDFLAESKQYSSKKSGDPFYELFFGMDVMNMACYDCNSRSSMAYSDIRLGDYWGEKYDLNTKGVSAFVVGTMKGVEFFKSIESKIHVEDATFENILLGQSYGKLHTYNAERRKYLLANLNEENNLLEVVRKYRSFLPLSTNVKRIMKYIVKSCPKCVYFPIKKLVHSI